jgi:outer membrane protein OmpA-like peptidoglycan-associated protein
MMKIFGSLVLSVSLFLFAAGSFAAFEDVATDDTPAVTTPAPTVNTQKQPAKADTKKAKSPAPVPVAPVPVAPSAAPPVAAPTPPEVVKSPEPVAPPAIDLNTLKFSKEITGWKYKNWDPNLPEVSQQIKIIMTTIKPLIDKLPPDAKIQVIGHTDGVGPEYPEGDKPGNIAIGERRANAVVDYLVSNYSIPRDRFVVTSKGSSEPKIASDKASPANRRVVIKFEP